VRITGLNEGGGKGAAKESKRDGKKNGTSTFKNTRDAITE